MEGIEDFALSVTDQSIPDFTMSGTAPDSCCAAQPVALLSGLAYPAYLALDATNVYVGIVGLQSSDPEQTNGEIIRCAKSGCGNAATVIAQPGNNLIPSGLAVVGDSLYWSNSDTAPKLNGNAGYAVGYCGLPTSSHNWQIALGTNLFGQYSWGDCNGPTSIVSNGAQFLITTNCAGGGATLVANPGGLTGSIGTELVDSRCPIDFYGVAADAKNAYWSGVDAKQATKGGVIMMCPLSGCTVSCGAALVTGLSKPAVVAADGISVYWFDNSGAGQVLACAVTGCANQPRVLASGQGYVSSFASDGVNVYWTDTMTNKVLRCAVNGCSGNPTVIAAGQTACASVALDSTSVYWVNVGTGTDGAVMRIAK